MKIHIKPLGIFEEGRFEGPSEIVEKIDDHHYGFQANGFIAKISRWNWERAVAEDKWIRLSKGRCTLQDGPAKTMNGVIITQNKAIDPNDVQPIRLNDVNVDPQLYVPIKTGTGLDVFFSKKGGIMPGTVNMIAGDPGIGKSSVLMDAVQGIMQVDPSKRVLFISAEMDRVDMMDPDEFMSYYPGLINTIDFIFAADYIEGEKQGRFIQELEIMLNRGYDVVVMDSFPEVQSIIQMTLGINSSIQAETILLDMVSKYKGGKNERGVYTAFLNIQQITKGGEFKGSQRLVHMITSLLMFKWCEKTPGKKYMIFRKNRKGAVKRRLYFSFGPSGVEYDMDKYQTNLEFQNILDGEDNLTDKYYEMSKDEAREFLNNPTQEEE